MLIMSIYNLLFSQRPLLRLLSQDVFVPYSIMYYLIGICSLFPEVWNLSAET